MNSPEHPADCYRGQTSLSIIMFTIKASAVTVFKVVVLVTVAFWSEAPTYINEVLHS